MVGRGAVNQKGPQSAFLAALHAIKAAGKKLPVNFVFVAEGEEEIGSPHFGQVVHKPEVREGAGEMRRNFYAEGGSGSGRKVEITLGAKGVIEVELTSSGEKWGRGPTRRIFIPQTKRVSTAPSWHLVQALNTLVSRRRERAGD